MSQGCSRTTSMTHAMHARPNVARSFQSLMVVSLGCAALGACGRRPDRAGTSPHDSTTGSIVGAAPSAVHHAHHGAPSETTRRDGTRMPTLADTVDPSVALRAYLVRARVHRATRDPLIWEPASAGTNGFRAFADTTISRFSIGDPGRVEGAAGSRYVTIPLTVVVVSDGTPVTLRGTATLRRAVVDGAMDAQRRWRIMRIDWGAAR